MTDFAQRHSELKQYALIAPNSVNILKDKLPAFAPVTDQNLWLDDLKDSLTAAGVTFIDVRATFQDHKMKIFITIRIITGRPRVPIMLTSRQQRKWKSILPPTPLSNHL